MPTDMMPEGKGVSRMVRYICDYCSYIYDPQAGDPDNIIPPGTPFEMLPEDWECPVCGATRDSFSPEDGFSTL